jgi:hypothetical protein
MIRENEFIHSLADYQQGAVTSIVNTLSYISKLHSDEPEKRQEISRELGVILLEAPTGSGKTLMVGRSLENIRGKLDEKTVWLWFAPYAGLVTQTQNSLVSQCGALRLRDVSSDRAPAHTKDGDVFVQTWGAVAANNKDARKIRRDKEDSYSLDTMLDELRDRGFRIGVVIDEAHLNFGKNAKAAASFYLDVLRPDFTILATATPNDKKLVEFEKSAGLKVESRVVVARDSVVDAGLNKKGLMVGILSFKEEEREFIDPEVAALTAGWHQHRHIKNTLFDKDIKVTPLMLVQVEDQKKGAEDPVAKAKVQLIELGVPADAIAVHTSGEPDPQFHTLAYDPKIEVLIFKVAVATGFDAPRAWTLVSLRPNRGKEFGLQIVGRIMRVHSSVRPFHGDDDLIDRGYVFLTDPAAQVGLSAAADDLKAVRQGIELITDQLNVTVLGGGEHSVAAYGAQDFISPNAANETDEEKTERFERAVQSGLIRQHTFAVGKKGRERALDATFIIDQVSAPPLLFKDLPENRPSNVSEGQTSSIEAIADFAFQLKQKKYSLRKELGVPDALIREELPNLYDIEGDLCPEVARVFCQTADVLKLLTKVNSNADLSLRDLFNEGEIESRKLNVRMSAARIAELAQKQFQFNDGLDPRKIRLAIEKFLKTQLEDEGHEANTQDIRRTINLAVLKYPSLLKDAVRQAQSLYVTTSSNELIPEQVYDVADAEVSTRSAYGIYNGRYNKPERAFAQMLDEDKSGLIKWWLRNAESERWATRIILPDGRRFFPDFAIGINGRKTPDSIALVEIKDSGVTGRLHADNNSMKIHSIHKDYKKVFWSFRRKDELFVKAIWNETYQKIFEQGPFEIKDMVMIS